MYRLCVVLFTVLICGFYLSSSAYSQSIEESKQFKRLPFEHLPRYVCPMHSHISQDHEGTCPICGMQLVAQKSSSKQLDVQVSGAMQQAMALTTYTVSEGVLPRFITTFGAVQFDETGLSHLHPRASGWIEKLTVNSVGQEVQKGELLYEMYSPDLLVAQEDFLSLLSTSQNTSQTNGTLLQRGRRRLSLLGLNNNLIAQIERTRQVLYRVPYYAKENGIVSVLNVREGMYVEASDRIMTLADLSKVWVIADVFAQQLDWVEVGQTIEIDLPSLQLKKLKGSVEFVYPTLNATTRTLQVRMVVANPQLLLKPDMLAKVRIYAEPIKAMNIPIDALIQTEQTNSVFVRTDDTHFQRRDIEIGVISQKRVQVISGLHIGEKVVTAGQFLLDAEASLSNVATVDNAEPAMHMHH